MQFNCFLSFCLQTFIFIDFHLLLSYTPNVRASMGKAINPIAIYKHFSSRVLSGECLVPAGSGEGQGGGGERRHEVFTGAVSCLHSGD